MLVEGLMVVVLVLTLSACGELMVVVLVLTLSACGELMVHNIGVNP